MLFLLGHNTVNLLINTGYGNNISISELANLLRKINVFKGDLSFEKSMPEGIPLKRVNTKHLDKFGWKGNVSLKKDLK